MKFPFYTFMMVLALFFHAVNSNAQDAPRVGALITGSLVDAESHKPLKDFQVLVQCGGKTCAEATSKRNKYEVYLEKGKDYTVIFAAVGYWNKVMQVNLTGGDECIGLYKMEIDGNLRTRKTEDPAIISLENVPVAKAGFTEACDLVFDPEYSREMQLKWEKAWH